MATKVKNPDVLKRQAGITTDQVVANILATWHLATDANREDGAQWYGLVRAALAEMAGGVGVSLETAAAVTAHLSPRMHWSKNLIAAHKVLHNLPVTGVMGRSLTAARFAIAAYLAGDDPLATLNGPKVSSFAANMLGDDDAVTIDVWAARVAWPDFSKKELDLALDRVGVYDALAEAYRIAAARVGVSPSTMQATTWIVARNGRAS